MLTSLARIPRSRSPRVIIYARVSKDQKGGRSVTQQLTIGRRVAAEQGWEIVREYSDNAKSASYYAGTEREDWPKVEADIRAGEADILWVWEFSRGTRDLEVWAPLARVCREKSMYIALNEDVYDTTKASHMKQLNQAAIDAAYESDKTQERVNRDLAMVAEEGHPHGVIGFGFAREYDPSTGQLLRQVVRDDQAEVIREIADRIVGGESRNAIAADLNRRRIPAPGGKVAGEEYTTKKGVRRVARGWSHEAIHQLMTRPALIGKRKHKDRVIEVGGWDPVLDEATWRLIQEKFRTTSGRRPSAVRYLLSGVAVCGVCEAKVWSASRGQNRGPVYVCRGLYQGAPLGHVMRAARPLEDLFEGLLFERFADPDVLDAFQVDRVDPQDVEEARGRLVALEGELEDLYRDVESGRVSRRLAAADEARLNRDVEEARNLLRPRRVDPLAEALAQPSAEDVERVWRGWTIEQRRSALAVVTEEIRVLKVSTGPGGTGRRKLSAEESLKVKWVGDSTD